jgi:hypothetical protein
MADQQHDDHNSDKESRESRNSPNNGHSRLDHFQNRQVSLSHHPHREIPELQHSDGHIETEQIETFLIGDANAGLRPYAVMIQFIHALSTRTAM